MTKLAYKSTRRSNKFKSNGAIDDVVKETSSDKSITNIYDTKNKDVMKSFIETAYLLLGNIKK